MIKKIITIICIILLFCGLASVYLVKQQKEITVKSFDELEINFEATDHTASIVESEDYVFYATTDGIYRKEKNSGDLCTRIVKGEATALQVFSNTLYFVTKNKTKLCSVDFDGKNFNEVYEKPQDYVNRTITDYVAFGNGLVIADSAYPHYYDIVNKKQYDIFETPTTLTSYDVKNQMLYYGDVYRKNLEDSNAIYNDENSSRFSNQYVDAKYIVAFDDCVCVLNDENKLYKLTKNETKEITSLRDEKIMAIRKSGKYLYVMFEKHAERIEVELLNNCEYLGAVSNYDGGNFIVIDEKVYYKTTDGYSIIKRTSFNRISGTMFSCYTDLFYYELSVHEKKDNKKVSNTPILNWTDMFAFANKEFNSQKNPHVVLTEVIYYPKEDIWRFIVADRYLLERYIVDHMVYNGSSTYGYFDVLGKTGVRTAELRYEHIKNK